MKKFVLASASVLVLACGAMAPAHAADVTAAPDTGEWRFTLAPYAWGVGLSGDIGLFGRGPVDVDIPFSDILENLNFAAMLAGEAHNGTWGVFADFNYTSLSANKSDTRYLERIDGVVDVDVSADVTEVIATLMGEWRAVDADKMTLDLMAGGRYWNVQNDVSASVTLGIGGTDVNINRELSGSDGASWVDPMIGIKSRIDTDSAIYFTGWGMVGGAGVGSDFSWDVMGGVGYQWTEKFGTVLAYRALGVDYDQDGFVYDVVQQGVALGAVFSF